MANSWTPQLKAKFGTLDGPALQQLDQMVQSFEAAMVANKPKDRSDEPYALKTRRAVNQLIHSLVLDPAQEAAPRVLFRLEAREIDFVLADNIYSTTPRLLMKVPAARDDGASGPVKIEQVGDVVAANVIPPKLTDNTVLIIPNQEGGQSNLAERPVVQVTALSPGEYVIWSNLKLTDRKTIYGIVNEVMNPPEGKNAFQYFDEAATVEDLAKIVLKVQALGFGNMYNSHEKFRTNNVQPLPAFEGKALESSLSGFYEKPVNAVANSAVFLPGPIMFVGRGRSEETLPENGYAVFEQPLGAEDYTVRPLSPHNIAQSYVYRRTRANVEEKPAAGLSQVMFIPDHPLRDFVREFTTFQNELVQFNKGVRPQPKATADFNAKVG